MTVRGGLVCGAMTRSAKISSAVGNFGKGSDALSLLLETLEEGVIVSGSC